MEKRQEWCKSGSALSANVTMKDGHILRLNKRGASSNLTGEQWSKFLQGLPAIYASAAFKFENGKRRFLYPTDIVHYFIQSFTLHAAEGSLNSMDRVGMPDDCEAKLHHVMDIC